MAKTGATLKTPHTPKGILDLEFAYNASKAYTVINAWPGVDAADKRFAAIQNTLLDFIFLFTYSLFLYHTCSMLAAYYNGLLYKIGGFLAKGALAAGVLDVFENIGMLITLHGHVSTACSLFTFIFSIIKWMLVLAIVLYILFAGGLLLFKKNQNKVYTFKKSVNFILKQLA